MNTPQHLGTFIYRYAGGPVYEVRADSDTALHWRCLEGDDQGRQAQEVAHRVVIRPGVHFLSWVETDGLVVAQVVDFEARTVNTILVLPGGQRIMLQGTVERV